MVMGTNRTVNPRRKRDEHRIDRGAKKDVPNLVALLFIIPMSSPRLTLDRRHSFSGEKSLDWFFQNRKWIRTAGNSLVEAAWAIRDLPEGEADIRFLLLASKRNYKRAHDRNKIRRWLRAAITETPEFASLEDTAAATGKQLLVMLRISKPMLEVKWSIIKDEIAVVARHLHKRNLTTRALS
jgi:ribonuclease P protein component